MRFLPSRVSSRTVFTILAAALVLGIGTAARAVDYYVSSGGSDADPGTQSHPWQSLAKVNATPLNAGDRVLLASEATFPGGLILDGREAGKPGKPIVIRSTRKKRATILATGQTAISAVCGGITIQNLILKGTAVKADKKPGIAFYTDDKSGAKQRGIQIEDVEIAGFGGDGLSLGSCGDAGAGYEDVRISSSSPICPLISRKLFPASQTPAACRN